ncbi:ER lumen protein-retaining receptor 1-A [Sciurus carolinensis]|uniref:ER lumen protein-retaining receptor 1-A n=1 Tax=Sciurus carolinensis TaxID=30640 RepID=A0AA41MIR4_SCICA|nr:ER lumen protein-retaining receptor 1-A [Sciurus carolinensis]
MNLLQFLGDLSHLLAIILLLLKIWKSRSCAGISGKSQVLFAVVFTAHYLNLFTNYISLYNTWVKPMAILSFLINHDFTPLEILWTFCMYLESVTILLQLFMVSKTGEAETITSHYLFALGVYRTLYLFNWIKCYHFEGFFDFMDIVTDLVQSSLYWRNETLCP